MRNYNSDPYWTTARFTGTCTACGEVIRRGERIFYYPLGRKVRCEPCGADASRDFESRAFDEAVYASQY